MTLRRSRPYWSKKVGGVAPLVDYTTYELLYSVARRLNPSYSGALFRVRRDSDNTELDISFVTGGEMDSAALASFCSGTTGRLQKMYNQGTGGSVHDAAYFSGTRSLIYSGGAVITVNGKPAILGQTNNRYDCTNKNSSASYKDRYRIESAVFRTPGVAADGTIYSEFNTGITSQRFTTNCDTTTNRAHQSAFIGAGTNVLLSVQATQNQQRQHSCIQFNPVFAASNIRPFWDGALQVARSFSLAFAAGQTIRGLFMFYSNATHMQGHFQEYALKLTGGSNDETELRNLETEQNNYYGIY